jgi:hypothetical protein
MLARIDKLGGIFIVRFSKWQFKKFNLVCKLDAKISSSPSL